MAEIPTFTELYDAAKAEIQTRNPALTDFEEGSALDAITGASGILADEATRVVVDQFAAQFFATATGADLDDLAFDRLRLLRNEASTSTATLTWTRVASGSYVIPAGTTFAATNANGETVTFSSDAAVTVGGGDVTVDIDVTADEVGRASNVDVGTITTVVDTVASDPSATVTNAARAAGGAAEETDEAFRERIAAFYSSVQRGTKAALEFGAKTVDGVSIATVVEQYPITYVYVGDPDGSGNSSLAALVATELENWRATGSYVEVYGSTREELALSLAVVLDAEDLPADLTTLSAAIKDAIEAYGDTLGAGQKAYRTLIECAAREADDRVLSVTGTTDLTPSANQNAIRFPVANISLSFTAAG